MSQSNNDETVLVPKGWCRAKLGDIANQITKGTTPTTAGFQYLNSGIPFIKIENINKHGIDLSTLSQFIFEEAHQALLRSQFQEGDILFSIAGTIGKTALVTQEHIPANTKQAVAVIRGTKRFFDAKFLRQHLKESAETIAKNNARGGAMNNISLSDLKEVELSIPPLAEQQQIAAKLDELLVQVNTLKTRLDTFPKILKRLRQSVLAAAVSGRLTEDWREKFDFEVTVKLYDEKIKEEKFKVKINNLASPSPLLKRPSWLALQFGHLFNVKSGVGLTAKDMATYGTIPVYGGNGITGYHDQSNITEATIVIGRVGFYCGSVHLTENNAWVTDNVLIVSFPKSLVTRDFAFFLLKATNLRKDSASTAQPVISGTKIYPIEISLPPTEEQIQIVRRVEQLFTYADQIEQRVKDAQAKVNHLTQSILAKAFRGELTAGWREQNPDLISGENSVEALLVKIKAEREKIKSDFSRRQR